MDKKKIISVAVIVLAVVVGGYLYYGKSGANLPLVAKTETVAKVNGVDITKEAYESQLAASITAFKSQGIDVTASTTEAAIRAQVLNDMINNELVNQGIASAKITATPAEIDAQIQVITTQLGGEDKLKEEMAKAQITDAKLRENVSKQITIQKYLVMNINVASTTVSDAEVTKYYNDNVKGQTNAPALKDVKDQIKQQLTIQKEQALITAFIDTLRVKAQIETTVK